MVIDYDLPELENEMIEMPTRKVIIPPKNGWEDNTYYAVEAAFSICNPIHKYIFFSGFLDEKNKTPAGYNHFMGISEDRHTIANVYYMKVMRRFGKDIVNEGFVLDRS